MSLTPLAIAALALLNERAMHPYEMYQILLERHQDRLVKVRPGSLYHAVERLRVAELVEATGTEREGNRPERTTYAITKDGQRALDDRISELIRHPVPEYPSFPVALSEAHNLTAAQTVDDLTAYADTLDGQIDEIAGYLQAARQRGVPEPYWIAGDFVLNTTIAKRDWIRTLINRIETKDLTWQPHLG